MKASPLYAPMQGVLDTVFPGCYLLEAAAGVDGVDFVLKQKIDLTVNGTTTTSYRIIGLASGDWVKVLRNWNSECSMAWFGYSALLRSAIAFLKNKHPAEQEESLHKSAQKMVREKLKNEYPQRFADMSNAGNYLIMNASGRVPDWKEMDSLSEALASRFRVDAGEVTLIVVTGGEHDPTPAKQGLYQHDIRFHRVDALYGALKALAHARDIRGNIEFGPDGIRLTLQERLNQISGQEVTSILNKTEIPHET